MLDWFSSKLFGEDNNEIRSVPKSENKLSKSLGSLPEFSKFKKEGSLDDYNERIFEKILSNDYIDVNALKKYAWNGVPVDYRAITWKILLGYVPTVNARRENTLNRKRNEYFNMTDTYHVSDYEELPDHEKEVYHQIEVDIPRTRPDEELYRISRIQEMEQRILYIWGMRHPASGYVQGINDILTAFINVFLSSEIQMEVEHLLNIDDVCDETLKNVEADCFWCLSAITDFIQDNYTDEQPGIMSKLVKIRKCLKLQDEELYRFIKQYNPADQRLLYIEIAFRWMNCLLSREVPHKCIYRLFDTYCADENFGEFHLFVCVAFLQKWKNYILLCREHSDFTTFIQNPPTENWTEEDISTLISEAYIIQITHQDHLST